MTFTGEELGSLAREYVCLAQDVNKCRVFVNSIINDICSSHGDEETDFRLLDSNTILTEDANVSEEPTASVFSVLKFVTSRETFTFSRSTSLH